MPFPLTDLKRSYGRSGTHGGVPDVRPFLLAGSTLAAGAPRVQAVIDWHAAHVGRRRAEADFDKVAQLAGDYRLARCLAACLQRYYRFMPDDLEARVAAAGGRRAWSHLLERGITSPSDLRLHVFDAVQAAHGGFVAPEARTDALASVAAGLRLNPAVLDEILWLDAEENERLAPVSAPSWSDDAATVSAPTVTAVPSAAAGTGSEYVAGRLPAGDAVTPPAAEVIALYNRRAVETLLVRALSADLLLPNPNGDTIRRFYFLVKRHGLLCELSLADPARGPAGGVTAHLFGPLEVFGPRTRHGERFAGLVMQVLRTFAGVAGSARILLNDREYTLRLDADLCAALAGAPDDPSDASDHEDDDGAAVPATAVVARERVDAQFDSEVEARLFATLRGMERRGDLAGWHVEREAEPVIRGDVVFVPDFLLTRAATRRSPEERVHVEVIGFWTPAYRQRKREKLQRLAGAVPLALVVQEQLAADFADLPFPVLTYKHRVSADELLRLLRRHFSRAASSAEDVRAAVAEHLATVAAATPLVSEADLRDAAALSSGDAVGVLPGGWTWIPGLGAARDIWLSGVHATVEAALASGASALDAVRSAVAAAAVPAAAQAAENLEVLLPRLGHQITWESLFDATVTPVLTAPARPA